MLDLRELSFLDSTGIGCWVETRTHATALGKRMTIRDVPAAVRRVLEIGGLLALFEEGLSAPSRSQRPNRLNLRFRVGCICPSRPVATSSARSDRSG